MKDREECPLLLRHARETATVHVHVSLCMRWLGYGNDSRAIIQNLLLVYTCTCSRTEKVVFSGLSLVYMYLFSDLIRGWRAQGFPHPKLSFPCLDFRMLKYI